MILGDAIYKTLSEDTTISGYVGDKIYPVVMPSNRKYPAIVYNEISVDPADDKDGTASIENKRLQIDVYASKYKTAKNIAISARTALDNLTGTVESNVIDRAKYINESEGYEADVEIFRVTQDYSIRIKR